MENRIFSSLDKNHGYLQGVFLDCDDVVMRPFTVGDRDQYHMLLVYTDNIVSTDVIEDAIMTNLMNRAKVVSGKLRELNAANIAIGEMKEVTDFQAVADAVLIGDTVLFMEGNDYALVASTKGWPTRGVPQAETEVVVEGPKDAFTESMSTNIVLIRRRIRDTNLKVKRQQIARRSKTGIGILYLEGVVRPEVLAETKKRLDELDIDGILDSGQLEQLMEKNVLSPFPRMQLTERPDKAASAILEGRIALVVDNTPFVMLVPATLNVFFQAAEDYYARWEIMSFMRCLRYLAAFLAVALPGLYLALTLYHPSMIPTALALKIAEGRLRVPFPAVIEVVLMELAFELLREAGVRLPAPVSSTIGIVGGIIIGQAAVDAGLVGPAVVIVAAVTGICTFVIPNPSMVNGLRLCKYLIIALSATLGLYGFWLGMLLLFIHLAGLTTFGFPYLYPFCSGSVDNFSDLKDSIIRMPSFLLKRRPIFARPSQRIRMRDRKGGK